MGIVVRKAADRAADSKKQESSLDQLRGKALWEEVSDEFNLRSVFMEVYGDTGTGRSTFALSAPGPIAYMNSLEKVKGIVEPIKAAGKMIRLHHFGQVTKKGGPKEVSAEAMVIWKRLREAWYDAFGWARTVVMDTHTEGWELVRNAYFGDLKPDGGRIDAMWGPVNAAWRSLFKHYRTQEKCNLIIIGQTKDEYKSDKKGKKSGISERTGNTIRAGQKEIPYLVDVVVRTDKEDGSFSATIEKGWFNAAAEGTPFVDDEANFATVMAYITGTEPEEWEE